MEIQIAYDNQTSDPAVLHGWGFSCLIDRRILFDTGEAPEPLFHNLRQLDVDINRIEAVVISHEHWDHIGGLWELLNQRPGLTVFGCPGFSDDFKQNVRQAGGRTVESPTFRDIDSTIALTGEIPSSYKGMPMPEQAIILKGTRGISIVTGCSHPGILTMINTAKGFLPESEVSLVLGGFHLLNEDVATIAGIASSMQASGVQMVAPTHCTGEVAREIFKKAFGTRCLEIGAGSLIQTEPQMEAVPALKR